ncbi:MAG: hypothetical protein V3R94_03845, partial [Acidobacteriota bacterium]
MKNHPSQDNRRTESLSTQEIRTVDAAQMAPESPEIRAVEKQLTRCFPDRSISRVLLVVPPDGDANHFSYETCKLGRYPNFPAYGLGVLAAQLRQNGIDVDIVNLNNAILKACRATDNEESFDFSGVVLDELKRVL